MSSDRELTPTTRGDSQTRLEGIWLVGARIVWIILVSLIMGIFLYGLTAKFNYYYYGSQPPLDMFAGASEAEVLGAFAEINLSLRGFAVYTALVDALPLVIALVIGAIIFWQRSNYLIGLLASFAIITIAANTSQAWFELQNLPTVSSGILFLLRDTLTIIGTTIGISLFMVFPNGGFSPKWMRWVFWLIIGMQLVDLLTDGDLGDWGTVYGGVSTLVMVGAPTFSLIYRFRTSPRNVVRQQIKWVAYAWVAMFAMFAFVMVIIGITPTLVPNPEPSGGWLLFSLFLGTITSLPSVFISISIGIAITRYGLWNIDIVINRSIVYGLLTATLGAVFLLAFGAIQAVWRSIVGVEQALYPAVISGILVAGLFSPTRKRLRHFVDRRFYGIELNYTDGAKNEADLQKALSKDERNSSFGKYKALGLIGRGGMGEVFKASDPATGEAVAIKTLYVRGEGDREELVKRFHREAQAIEDLQHENIVKLFDYGEEGEVPYMVMEYIAGNTLSELIRARRAMSLDEVLPVFTGIAAALDFAHGRGIVHRDIKPSNVIVEQSDGKPPRAVLMDFGIARMVSAMTALTGTGGMVGTLDYIAPEQIQGAHQVDGRADIYSFGAMAYQTLTGELPFKQRNPGALIMAHLSTPAPDAREVVKDLPRGAAKAIQKAMAKEAADRFETAGAFVEAIRAG